MESMKMPKYYRIKKDIIDKIESGELKPKDKVDSESKLKKRYNVSTITVRKAFTDLINEGYLIGVQGKGTFVAKRGFNRGLTSMNFTDELIQQGYEVDLFIDDISKIQNPYIAKKLAIEEDAYITKVSRVRYANKEPMAYQTSYLSEDILSVEEAQNLLKTKSFYQTLASIGIFPTWGIETYSIKEIEDAHICKLMNVKKREAMFSVNRIAYDEKDNLIEYSESYFNKEGYSITVMIKK